MKARQYVKRNGTVMRNLHLIHHLWALMMTDDGGTIENGDSSNNIDDIIFYCI